MRYYFLALVFVCCLFNTKAQRYGFINYNVENGLAQSQVNAIGQDGKGYLWFATNGGVSRFDGKSFFNFYAGDGLLDNQVNCIHADKQGRIWLGTLGGLNLIEGKKISSFPFESINQQYAIKSIAEDKNGLLWIATDGGGLFTFSKNEKKLIRFESSQNILDNYIRSLCFDEEGILWVGTKKGVVTIADNKAAVYNKIDTLANISSVVCDKGVLWVTTFGNGVYRHDKKGTQHFADTKDGLIELWVKSVTVDKEANAWFSSSAGLCKYDGKDFVQFKSQQGLDYVNINTSFSDREGNLWLGSEGNGTYRFSGEGVITYSSEDGLGTNIVMSISQNKNGEVWLGTYGGGVAVKKNKTFSSLPIPGGISQNYVFCSLVDADNNNWFGTGFGLYKYNGKDFQVYDSKKGLMENTIMSLLLDSKGNIWAGTTAGAFKFDGDNFVKINLNDNPLSGAVYNIYEDKNSTLWFASEMGLISFDGQSFKNHKNSAGNKIDNIFNVTEDKEGNLWLGTSGGLLYYNKKDFNNLTLSDNFSSNQIMSIHIDEENILWAGTNNGIYNFDIDEYFKNKQLALNHIGKLQGVRSIECNQNAIYSDNKGIVMVGTTGGLVVINKKKYLASVAQKSAILNFTGLRLFLQETDWSPYCDSLSGVTGLPVGLKIDYKKNHLTFDFMGILHSNPDNVRYKFKLEGFDENWYPFTKETYATYSNLSHGQYKFIVALTDERGLPVNTPPVEFSFIITPPFWKTWWFTVVVFVVAAVSGWLLYKWRWAVAKRKREAQQLVYKSKLMALEQETLNASLNRHFIFNALNSIQYYINRQDKLSANKYLSSFAKLIRKNLDSSQNNLVTLSEELERLQLYLSLEHMRFSKFSYDIVISPEIDPESLKIPPMILQPYVENSIWHGILPMEGDGKITVEIKKNDENTIVVLIEDNGIGIDESLRKKQEFPTEHDSKGMKITETRINLLRKMMGGNIQIKGPYDIKNEENGSGTRVEIILPIKK